MPRSPADASSRSAASPSSASPRWRRASQPAPHLPSWSWPRRDAQCHSHANFTRNGLPIAVQKRIAAEVWGSPDAVDPVKAYTPVNPAKIRMAKWALLRKELHDSISLCNWMGPWAASPLKERGYREDDSIESLLYSLVTGARVSREELDSAAERIFLLHRAPSLAAYQRAGLTQVAHTLGEKGLLP